MGFDLIDKRDIFDDIMRDLSKTDVVLDIGGKSPFHGKISAYESQFEDSFYICLDVNKDGEPMVVADAHNLPFRDEVIDGIICHAVLEHLPEPWKALDEIYRVMRKGGKGFFTFHFYFLTILTPKTIIDLQKMVLNTFSGDFLN